MELQGGGGGRVQQELFRNMHLTATFFLCHILCSNALLHYRPKTTAPMTMNYNFHSNETK